MRRCLEAAALALGEAAPDSEALVVFERVFKALGAHLAGAAHLLRLPGGTTLLREERLRICLGTQRAVLPRHPPGVVFADTKDVEPERDDLSHAAPPFPPGNPVSARAPPGTDANYTSEITRACLASRQAGSVILAADFRWLTGKSGQKPQGRAAGGREIGRASCRERV